jgi:hydrogenase maturation protein HypF
MLAAAPSLLERTEHRHTVAMRVRGRVQGVGFRPTVWRLARQFGLDGDVRNDADGVLIRLCGPQAKILAFQAMLEKQPPPLARIESIQSVRFGGELTHGFFIVESAGGAAHTEISPDARICEACTTEIQDPAARRFGYALTNCTHCGPRLSIIQSIPYDRARTTMAPFAMCPACQAEYDDPADRRFHAEPTACPDCGPQVTCLALRDTPTSMDENPIAQAADHIRQGRIVAIKGLGGYQLACDATNAQTIARLRANKQRDGKPFALMARDLDVVRRYCRVSPGEAAELSSPLAPILLLPVTDQRLPEGIAPGLTTLGFMLPTTPLHVLLLQDIDAPVVMTSGNRSGAPQIIDDNEARFSLSAIASHILLHDRAVANRVDDSVVRFMDGHPRVLRRARGYAPTPIALPAGFAGAPEILALGGELKATFCLIKDGQAILSQHRGDLEEAAAFDDYRKNLALYRDMFDHVPVAVAADLHPEYLSSKLARSRPEPAVGVQHHHAHIASCLCENGYPLDAPPVLGIALDGLGWGADGTFWGGEFLRADYRGFQRLASFKPVAMPGGTSAVREPWRNLYAHIEAATGWEAFQETHAELDAAKELEKKPLATLAAMIAKGVNAPLASSCGRLFDAVAAAVGLCPGAQSYEGDAAARLEALAEAAGPDEAGYPFALLPPGLSDLGVLDPAPMWQVLFEDLSAGIPTSAIAARFHHGLARAIATTAVKLATTRGLRTVALSGGCFQNRLLFEAVTRRLCTTGLTVLSHSLVPANDGGLSLGQATVAAARLIPPEQRIAPCV